MYNIIGTKNLRILFRLETMTRPKKLIKSRKVRHASSGGSSGEFQLPRKHRLSTHRSFRMRKSRLRTKSESKSEQEKERTPLKHQEATEVKSEEEELLEENYDEFDTLTKIDLSRSRNFSGSGDAPSRTYLRSLSEGVQVQSIHTHTTTGSNCSHNTCSEEEVNQRSLKKIMFAAKHRRQIQGRRKDYTSITDDLELMIATSPPLDLPIDQPSSPPQNLPAIQIETECLHDAEEADYELMETIIHNRLKRDSNCLAASLEDLVSITTSQCGNFRISLPLRFM